MAAPPSAYNDELFNYAQFCYRLSEYDGNEKLLFYLDALFVKNDSGFPFIGAIKVGSVNYSMHNPSRINDFKFEIGSDVYELLEDGGLNTSGTVSIGSLSSIFGLGVIIPITYRNAFYVDSDDIRIMYRKNGSPTWIEYSSRAGTPQGEELTYNGYLTSVDGDLHPNDLVYVKVKNINVERTFTSDEQSLTLPRPSLIMAHGVYASYAYANFGAGISLNTYYFSEYELAVGVLIAEDETGSINTATGYFACLDFWIKVELNSDPIPKTEITKIGAIGTWDTGDPATPATYYPYTYYHLEGNPARWNIACALISTPGSNTPKTVYQKVADGKWYETTALSTFAPDGLYYTDDFNFRVFASGQDVGGGNCTTGPVIE